MSIPYIILSDSDDEMENTANLIGAQEASSPHDFPVLDIDPQAEQSDEDLVDEDPEEEEDLVDEDPEEEEDPEEGPEEDEPTEGDTEVTSFQPSCQVPTGTRTRLAARKSVGLPQQIPRATVGTSTPPTSAASIPTITPTPTISIAPPPIATTTPTPVALPPMQPWEWLSDILNTWEAQEGPRHIYEHGESSNAPPRTPFPLPQDPVTALLVTRLARMEQENQSLRHHFEHLTQNDSALQGQILTVEENAHLTYQGMGSMQSQLEDAQRDIRMLRHQLEQSERYAVNLTRQLADIQEMLKITQTSASTSKKPDDHN